jgi:hypothetical protein
MNIQEVIKNNSKNVKFLLLFLRSKVIINKINNKGIVNIPNPTLFSIIQGTGDLLNVSSKTGKKSKPTEK